MSKRNRQKAARQDDTKGPEADLRKLPPMEPQEIREGDTSGGQRPSERCRLLTEKEARAEFGMVAPMTTQQCWNDAEFPAAFIAATAAMYATGAFGPGENGWKASMAVGEICAEHFVRRLRGMAEKGGA